MPYEPLHHKYRPQTFAELVGQNAIATTLTFALRQQKIAPAYLFTGARGTGKTSSARILAKSLNCLESNVPTEKPCGHCEVCRSIANGSALDVIEIDAASNTGVDNIRELIERAQFAPVQCRYKVYVIDECLSGDSLVLTDRGLMRIDDPTICDRQVLSHNDASGEWEWKRVLRWLDQGVKQTYEIKTTHRKIRCTGNHLIRTDEGWIAAIDLRTGMKILAPQIHQNPIDSATDGQSLTRIDPSVPVAVGNGLSCQSLTSEIAPASALFKNTGSSFPVAKITICDRELFPGKPNFSSFEQFLMWLSQPGTKKLSRLNGWQTSRRKDLPGGTWTTDRSAVALAEAQAFNYIQKDFHQQRISLSLNGSTTSATQSNEPTQKSKTGRLIPTLECPEILQENGWLTSSNIQSLQWNTSLESIESIELAKCENVYDIEVEDNHNFVANGLTTHNCHMLSSASFNALLKTLEEPPDRVVFVLATTDPQRVLPTIISRCQRFDFRRIELGAMVQHLGSIAAKESISINPAALQLIAQISQGGLRDAESLLDQLSLLEGEIVPDRVWDLVGAVPERELLALVQAIADDDGVGVLDRARHLLDRGREPLVVLQNLTSFYRDMLIAKTSPDRIDLVAITPPTWATLCEFVQSLDLSLILFGQQHLRACEIQVKNTTQPRLWLEVTLLGLLPSARGTLSGQTIVPNIALPAPRSIAPPPKPAPAAPPTPAPPSLTPEAIPAPPQPIAPPPNPTPEPAIASAATNSNGKSHATNGASNGTPSTRLPDLPPPPAIEPSIAPQQDFSELWEKILGQVQPFSTQIMLRQQCQLIHFNGQEARIGARSEKLFKMAKDRLPNIEDAFAKLYSQRIKVTLEVLVRNEGAAPAPVSPNPPLYPPPQTPAPPAAPQVREEPRSPHSFGAGATGSSSGSPPIAPSTQTNPAPIKPAELPAQPVEAELPAASVPPAGDFIEPAAWVMEDEVTRAAKSLAQMFNGQVVSWEEGTEGEADLTGELLQVGQAGLEALDSDPDGDVPF